MFVPLYRICKFALQNFWRNVWLSTVTISIMVLALMSVNFFILLNALLDKSIQTIEQKVNVTVYFQPTAQDADIKNFISRVSGLPEATAVDFVSKDTALEHLKSKYQNDQDIQGSLQELQGNPLTASAVIHAESIEGYSAILTIINDTAYQPLIERQSFDDRTHIIERISELKGNVKRVGTAVTLFFALIAVLIVMNTIRVTIYTRRREVGIMKLVGATNRFIRAPLFLEALLYSIIAVILTVVITFPLLSAIQPFVSRLFDSGALDVLGYFSDHFLEIFGYQLLASVLITMISSWIAIGRYLRV